MTRYTLWTIPRSVWSEPPKIDLTPELEAEMVEYARTMELSPEVQKRIEPYNTPIHPDTWHKIVP